MNGYWGKLLRVNMTDPSWIMEDISDEVLWKFIGGGALGAHYIIREVPAKTDPLSPENKIVFASGIMQSVTVPGNGKWSVMTISPLTGTFMDSAGTGHWATAFKKCGYDAIIIEGKATKPMYIFIHDDEVEFRDASSCWGQFTVETSNIIKAELGDKRINALNIGPAGEIMHPLACVTCDGHSFAGREGAGAVMGSKNLKAIACWGTKQTPVYDKESVNSLSKELFKTIYENSKASRQYGTSGNAPKFEAMGDLPIKYWRGERFEERVHKLGGPYYSETLNAKPLPCENCPIGCHRHIYVTLDDGEVLDRNGPEYECVGMQGSNCLVDNLMAIAKANDLCNQHGIDIVSAGAYVGFLMECYEFGWITEKDTDGVPVVWGSGDALVKMTEKICQLKGIGGIFRGGIVGAAKEIGREADRIIVHVKNSDYAAHDPRLAYSMGINYATGTRGACHMRGSSLGWAQGRIIPELDFNEPMNPYDEEQSPHATRLGQIISAVCNNLTICCFMMNNGFSLTKLCEMIQYITGLSITPKELCATAERGHLLQRLIGNRNGFDRKDDILPEKMKIPALIGPRKGKAYTDEMFNKMLDAYYDDFGFDRNGVVTEKKLKDLDLADYVQYIPGD